MELVYYLYPPAPSASAILLKSDIAVTYYCDRTALGSPAKESENFAETFPAYWAGYSTGGLQELTSTFTESIEKRDIKEALDQCDGNQTRAAELLSISRRTLIRKIHTYNLRKS